MHTFERLASEPLTICIDGPGGSGKSTLADALVKATGIPERQLIRGDWYYEPWPEGSEEKTTGYFNGRRFMEEVGEALNAGTTPVVREYDMKNDQIIPHEPPVADELLVVEGIKTLALPIGWSFGIWVEAPREIRERRFMERAAANRRSNITDPEVLRRSFNIWADDAEVYRQRIIADGLPHAFLQGEASTEELLGIIALGFELNYFSHKT